MIYQRAGLRVACAHETTYGVGVMRQPLQKTLASSGRAVGPVVRSELWFWRMTRGAIVRGVLAGEWRSQCLRSSCLATRNSARICL